MLSDPTIFYEDGVYYLYGTGGGAGDDGFRVFTSTDRKTWVEKGYVLKRGESFGTKGFWAPQVFKFQGKYYMAYTANEMIAVASADSPLGPFRQNLLTTVFSYVRMIDPYFFFDKRKVYLYHVRLDKGNRIFVAEIDPNTWQIKQSTLKECIAASEPWEDTQNADWKVTEGPAVLKHKNFYYLIYSANDFRNPDYAVGYAVSKSPVGPWLKYPGNPIISRKDVKFNGTGHGDVFTDKKGDLFYVMHTHFSNEKVSPRKTAIMSLSFKKNNEDADILAAAADTFQFLTK